MIHRQDGADAGHAVSLVDGLRPWLTLLLLTLVYMLAAIDKVVPQIVAESVRKEFDLSDSQLGFFLGTSFGVAHGVAGLLTASIIDRASRKTLLSAALSLWSVATLSIGFVSSYVLLLLGRATVGAGEAPAMPVSLSLISDMFPANRRSTAIGLFKISIPVGSALSGLIVGYVAPHYGWRASFLVTGIPGLILAAILYFWVREPVRGAMDGPAGHADGTSGTMAMALRYISSNPRMRLLTIGLILVFLAVGGVLNFTVPLLERVHGLSLPDAGRVFSLVTILGAAGSIALGVLADKLTAAGPTRVLWLLVASALVLALSTVGVAWPSSLGLVVFSLCVFNFIGLGFAVPAYGLILNLTPAAIRGSVMSIVVVSTVVLGSSMGPLAIGIISDLLGGGRSLAMAILILTGSASALAVVLFFAANKYAPR